MLGPLLLLAGALTPGPVPVVREESDRVRLWIPRSAPGTRHPAFVFAGGLQSGAEANATLCEWLATHGYVTAAFATAAPARYEPASVDIQLAELAGLIRQLRRRREVDADRIALGAWSFGGVAAALAAMSDRRIAALVSLDAATGYDYGYPLLTRHPRYAPARTAKLPFLHLADSFEKRVVAKDFRYAEQEHRGPVWLGELPALRHADFVSSDGAGGEAYPDLAERVRLFLDATLRRDRRAERELSRRPWRRAGTIRPPG